MSGEPQSGFAVDKTRAAQPDAPVPHATQGPFGVHAAHLFDIGARHIGALGALLIAIGVFCPLVLLPGVGSYTHYEWMHTDSIILLVLSGAAFPVSVFNRWLWLFSLLGILVAVTLVWEWNHLLSRWAQAIFSSNAQRQWGWAVLGVGTVCLLAAPFFPGFRRLTPHPGPGNLPA